MDSGTITAIVAPFVAVIALLVAFAQVAQQYIATADLSENAIRPSMGRFQEKGEEFGNGDKCVSKSSMPAPVFH
jgi:hypothetical protein